MNTATSASTGRVHLQRPSAWLAVVELDHPGRLNALTLAMWRALRAVFEQLAREPQLRCVVLRGAGENFAAGADIREFPVLRADKASVIAYHREILAPALHAVAACPVPTVAAIQGVCVGGGLELACQCDLRLAAADARFGAPINRLGFPMAPDEMRGLLALAGRATVMEILLEGRILDAAEAQSKGLLTRTVAAERFAAELQATTERICAGAPQAARLNKQIAACLLGSGAPDAQQWQDFFAYAESRDHRHGVESFLAGEKPVFTGE